MIFSWLRKRRRRRWLEDGIPSGWLPVVEAQPFYGLLDDEEQRRLREAVHVFVLEKYWEGCGGLQLTEEMQVTIATQACLLIVNRQHDYFRGVKSILIYPSAYFGGPQTVHAGGTVAERSARAGEAWTRGPVVLAWDQVQRGAIHPGDGHNLVYHEFAHKLDQLDGIADGTPVLSEKEHYRQWNRVMTEAYERLCRALQTKTPTLLDKYGTTNPAEFFAVATECFFERPQRLQHRHEDLYEVLSKFYRHDPARWELDAR